MIQDWWTAKRVNEIFVQDGLTNGVREEIRCRGATKENLTITYQMDCNDLVYLFLDTLPAAAATVPAAEEEEEEADEDLEDMKSRLEALRS